ncbi:hypothetical protein L3V77_10545 [Vibrio sp. DW001]|uniref:hypothetical protein n=1 Tax=Vibrio sp. DW001 TaxID=2912315 RepID=UPI0023AF2569|nr:hypothetical protein [Vibrio sp. DW001]WED25505.1 hypothetical protein L3V77_10545 [Vibrio sp. DW001]
MKNISPDVIARANAMSAGKDTVSMPGGSEIPDPLPMPGGSEIEESKVVIITTPEADRIDSTTTTTVTDEQGIGKTESPADTGVDPLLVVDARKTDKLEVGKLETYKESKKVTGDGSVHRDHQPAVQALFTRADEIKGTRLTAAEKRRISENAYTVTVPNEVHKAGPTYGGKNTSELQKSDASNLQGAATRDAETMVKNAGELSPENVSVLQSACDEIKCKTNEQYDDFLRDQLDE